MRFKPEMMVLYEYEQITYCLRLVKPVDKANWIAIVEGLIAPKKKLDAFTKKYSILDIGTEISICESDIKTEKKVVGLVVDPIGYIERQIYLFDEDDQVEESAKWKKYKHKFLPVTVIGGTA